MTGSNYLLDTVLIIAYFNNEPSIDQRLQNTTIYLPSIAVGELYFGAYRSRRVSENVRRIREFVAGNTVISCDVATAEQYGQIKQALRAKGRPIPENDIWIAALALQYGLILATRDAHFREVPNLALEVW
jgi:tRNA(fMet)-specific endonuclease VapC